MAAESGQRQAAPENTFVIGLAMAGAISAGAYTAGVLDTLFRALAEHERRFQDGEVDHRVVLKAMSGASAGGICAALGAAGLVQGVVPHDPDDPSRPGLPLLWDLWVDRLRLGGEGGGGLLGKADLEARAGTAHPVASILDSSHIDAEARALVADVRRGADGEGLGFLAGDLEIFVTTTNLMGVTYEVRFTGEEGRGHGHVMASHGTVEHFRLTGLGTVPCRSEWLRRWTDSGIVLKAPETVGARIAFGDVFGDALPSAWARLVRAAVASGAFPVGLASRRLDADYGALERRAWPIDIDPHERRPRPLLPKGAPGPVVDVGYIAVDGGVANNEPFELARYAIRTVDDGDDGHDGWRLAPNRRGARTADRAVIMIDPFPEGPEMTLASTEEAGRQRESGVLYVLRRLVPSLINQARFKPTELLGATDSAIHSRFLVAPSRTTPDGAKLRGAMAIASGFLGGFGGFFDRRFREHDYRLGQHNCRSFLGRYFVLDSENPVFAGRGDLLHGAEPGMRRILQVADDALPDFVDAAGAFHPRPDARGDAEEARWPGLSLDALDRVTRDTGARLGRVATLLMREVGITGWFKRLVARYLWTGVPFFGGGVRDALSVDLGNRIKGEMVSRDQLLASRHFADPRDRALYAAIMRNGGRRATPSELAAQSEIHLPTPDAPLNTLTLDAGEVEERAAAGIVRLWRYRGRWGLV